VLTGDGHPIAPTLEALSEQPLRVGVLGGWFVQGAFPEVLGSLSRVAQALDATPGVVAPGAEAARSAAFCLSSYEGARLHAADIRARPQDYDPAVRDRLLAGALLTDDVAEMAQRYRRIFQAEMRAVFADYDILLAPTTPCLAPIIGQPTMALNGQEVSVRQTLGVYTQPISFIGLPVLAAPVNRPGQLPAGVQIIAPAWREDLALAAGLRLQRQGVVAANPPEIFA
jgi:Asp-tRNA(Asn)/Glu-tRNA(Gln) amidotransferase A subunit family amidase